MSTFAGNVPPMANNAGSISGASGTHVILFMDLTYTQGAPRRILIPTDQGDKVVVACLIKAAVLQPFRISSVFLSPQTGPGFSQSHVRSDLDFLTPGDGSALQLLGYRC